MVHMNLSKSFASVLTATFLAAGAFPAVAANPPAAIQSNPNTAQTATPAAQNYYLKGGKFFGSSKTVKDESGKTKIQYFDNRNRMVGYGVPYTGKESGNKIVKYYDHAGKYLGFSTMAPDPDGGGVTTYKLASGMVFGTSVTKVDKATGDYVSTYFYGSGKLAGYSRRSSSAQAAQVAATIPKAATTAKTAKTAKTATKAATAAPPAVAQSPSRQSPVVYSNSGDSPVLVPASSKRKW